MSFINVSLDQFFIVLICLFSILIFSAKIERSLENQFLFL